ncbi:hypothetical protein [Bacillus rhizoplanae]|uniref:hypothetical protein n=1 Tax=Bacillus rhizoplanae TaxID=2880966 RepID=UPI003D25D3D3
MEKTAEIKKPYSKIAELLGKPQPDNITVTDKGVIIVEIGKPDVDKLIRKALSL